ncbi:uncharacterized protein LOC135927877 isoform X2 [Gordionus sp. m RMFG-2023]|uniref:uncharacterized protein LOC135927877 isoform X2 n=1 Tax=Gordionus sp. m RMFG-2023 TaxID=3053472 RepID=UPI0031FC7D9F
MMTMLKIILGISLFTTYSIHISQQVFVKAKPWFEEQKPTTNYRIYRLMKKPLIVNKDDNVNMRFEDIFQKYMDPSIMEYPIYRKAIMNKINTIYKLFNQEDPQFGLEIPDMLSQEKVYGQSFLNSDNNIKSLQNLMEQMLQKG